MNIRRDFKKLEDADAYAAEIERVVRVPMTVFGEEYAGGSDARFYVVQTAERYALDFGNRDPKRRRVHECWLPISPCRLFFDLELYGDLAEKEPLVLSTVDKIDAATRAEFAERAWDVERLADRIVLNSSRAGKSSKHVVYPLCVFAEGRSLAEFIRALVKRGVNEHEAVDLGLYGSARASLRLPYASSARSAGAVLRPAGTDSLFDRDVFLRALVSTPRNGPFLSCGSGSATPRPEKKSFRIAPAAADAKKKFDVEEAVARNFILRRWPTSKIEAKFYAETNEFVLETQCKCSSASQCACVPCAHIGAPHKSNRIFLVVQMPSEKTVDALRRAKIARPRIFPKCYWKCMDNGDCGYCAWMSESDAAEISECVSRSVFSP